MELTSLLGRFKQITEKIFKPFAKILSEIGLRPNHLTMIAFALSVLTAYLILVHDFAWAAVALLAAGGSDLLDRVWSCVHAVDPRLWLSSNHRRTDG